MENKHIKIKLFFQKEPIILPLTEETIPKIIEYLKVKENVFRRVKNTMEVSSKLLKECYEVEKGDSHGNTETQ